MKIAKKETRVSVRITPEQENMLDSICNELDIKRSTLVRFAIDQLIKNYSDLQLEQVQKEVDYLVNEELTKHYRYLHSRLVKSDADEATFNDSYLKLTRKYNPDQDFIDQFIYFFNQLRGEYMRDDKCYNYAETKVEIYADYCQVLSVENNLESLDINQNNQKNVMQSVKPNIKVLIKQYAVFEKEQKHKAQIGKKDRKTKHLPK